MSSHITALHSSIVSCLTGILSGVAEQRQPAEDELKALEVTEEFGLVLARIIASNDSPLQYRQLAAIILKMYVTSHWSRDLEEKFQEPEPPPNVKEEIRKLLPICLRDQQSKVRSTVAYAVSAIASLDWPENWPNLFDELMLALDSGEAGLVHGAMRVLSEFCHMISEVQLPVVIPLLFPVLLKVIVQSEQYTSQTRARAIKIFSVFSSLVYNMSGQYPEACNHFILPILPNYLSAFVELLSSNSHGNGDPGLRREAIMTLCQLLQYYPRPLAPHILTLVTPIWNILISSVESYVRDEVNNPDPPVGVCDSDGEVNGESYTLFSIFEFIAALSVSSFSKDLLLPTLPELVYILIDYMQITEEEIETWSKDVVKFVEDDEREFSYSVRLSAVDLVMGMCESGALAGACCQAIVTAVDKRLSENHLTSSQHAWKIHEACMLVCSCALEAVRLGLGELDHTSLLEQAILPALSSNVNQFLTGRSLWLASKMTHELKTEATAQLLEMVATALQSSQPDVLRVLAAKSAYYFCSSLKSTEHAQLLSPILPHFIRELCEMSGKYHEDVVSLVVDSLQLAAQVDPVVTAQYAGTLVPVANSLFLKYAHDPGVSLSVEELFQCLSKNPSCHGYLETRFVPMAMEILNSTQDQMPLGLVPAVMDILVHVVRGCGLNCSLLITDVFPAITRRVLNSDDSAILQNGGELMRAYVATCMTQLISWRDPTGTSGLEYVVKVMIHLLDPGKPEFSASYVGKLILVFVKKAGAYLGTHLELLLRSVLSKMQSVSSVCVKQSLLLVFACLIQSELEAVLTFLSQVPDATGQSALSFVLREWLTSHSSFYGDYELRMSTVSLCQLLNHVLTTSDSRVSGITVRSENQLSDIPGIITRSKRSQQGVQYSEVPVPVKIVQLLIGDISNEIEESASDDLSDDECDTIEDTLESLLRHTAHEQEEIEEDPDLVDEPVLQLDMKDYLVTYMRQLTSQPLFLALLTQLTREELTVLNKINIHI